MKARYLATLITTATLTGLLGCSDKTPSLNTLDEILNPTETQIADRSDLWYSKQENIRNSVLLACFTHFNEEARITGGQVLYDYYENPYALFNSIPDCINARKGEVITMSQQPVIQDEVEINNIQNQLQAGENEIHINQAAADVAKRLEALNAEKGQENTLILNHIYDTTKTGGELEKNLIDANLVQ